MLVHTGTRLQNPAAERTQLRLNRFDITQRLGATQRAFGDHRGYGAKTRAAGRVYQ